MAVLSMLLLFAATLKMQPEAFRRRNYRFPSQDGFQLLVGIITALPIGVPCTAIVHGRQLVLGPVGILLPKVTQQITNSRRQVERSERFHFPFVKPQKFATKRKVVINHIKN